MVIKILINNPGSRPEKVIEEIERNPWLKIDGDPFQFPMDISTTSENNDNLQEFLEILNDLGAQYQTVKYTDSGERRNSLIEMRDQLYSGSWDAMLKDLEQRLKTSPYARLKRRILDDIEYIKEIISEKNQN